MRRPCWCLVLLTLLCSASARASYSSSGSGSGRVSVEVSVGDGSSSPSQHQEDVAHTDEIQFPAEIQSGNVLSGQTATKEESTDSQEIVASPVATEPLLVLAAMTATPVPSTEASVKEKMKGTGSAQLGSGSVMQEVEVSTEAPQEMHGVPSNPTLVNAVAFDGRAAVTWKAPDDDGLDPILAYEVGWFDEEDNVLVGTQRVMSSSVNFVGQANASASTASADLVPTSTVVESLINGRSYTFKVRAQNLNGVSVWSAKSLAVSPLHPPDLCERLSCSGHGTCFPNYHDDRTTSMNKNVQQRVLSLSNRKDSNTAIDEYSLDALCVCRPGYSPPDCSAKTSEEDAQYGWQVTMWSECDSGCGGGRRSRDVECFDVATNQKAPSEEFCTGSKPLVSDICNGIECGSMRVVVQYKVEMSYDEVLFSPAARESFELAFTTEVASALQIHRSRLEISSLERGSIVVLFQILPASRAGEKSLNDIVENLQDQLSNETSTLRSMGTFARRIEPNGAKLSFSIADQTVAGGAEDISIAGLIGTIFVLGFFVSMFAWFLRRRHYRLLKDDAGRKWDGLDTTSVNMEKSGSDMKRMNIKSTK